MERPRPTRVRGIREIAQNISLVRMDNSLEQAPKPGQFVMVWNGKDEKPMAVTMMGKDELSITVKQVGPFTKDICGSKPGNILGIRGPYGRPFNLSYENPLLVAGGIGASPIMYLASHMKERGLAPRILVGFNTKNDAIYIDELQKISDTTICCVDGSFGLPGMATDNLPPLNQFDCVFACGPEPMMATIGRRSEEANVKCQLLVERYFKCGIGLCGSCSLGRLIPCRDGPVFYWRELKGTEFGFFKRNACGLRQPLS